MTATNWKQIKRAFRRDWEQTKADLTGGVAGEELDQTLADTLEQLVGRDPLAAEREPLASWAFELGYNAAGHYSDGWNERVEADVRESWNRIAPETDWFNFRATAYLGWRHRRRHPDLTRAGAL